MVAGVDHKVWSFVIRVIHRGSRSCSVEAEQMAVEA